MGQGDRQDMNCSLVVWLNNNTMAEHRYY